MTPGAVFLDSVGLLALWDVADQWHAQADAAFKEITAQRRPVVTTTYILLECGNAAARRPYRSRIGALRRTLELRQEVIVPDENDWAQAWAAYDRGEAGAAGIVDHVSFVVMRRLGLTEAFTNDRHFRAAGFTPLF
jgi:predicted nucleic acid-binding protein